MKMFLTLKQLRTLSQTEISTENQYCAETTANLVPVESA